MRCVPRALAAGLLAIALPGCATAPTAVAAASPADDRENKVAVKADPGLWERAPTPRIRETRYDVFRGSATRARLGWPDRYTGASGGGIR